MTPGYDAGNPTSAEMPSSSGGQERDGGTERLGPRPPRIEAMGGHEVTGVGQERPGLVPGPSVGDHGFPSSARHRPAEPVPAPTRSSQQTAPFTGGGPAAPGSPVSVSSGGYRAGYAGPARPGRTAPLAPIALTITLVLLAVAVVQTLLLFDTRSDLDQSRRQLAAADARIKGLESRATELEQRTGNTLDAQAVATDVLPSVFRVVTQDGLGTGFAFGAETAEGGTYLLTNAHVVQGEWNRGVKVVALEQKNRRFNATIVKIDSKVDLALLSVTDTFPRLQPSPEPAKPGQPVVVIGAPLGLEDSVTSGVVSSLRATAQGEVLQFDAAINPGNSGGPVVNAQRQVVGVVNAKIQDAEGISLGIPVAVVCQTFGLC